MSKMSASIDLSTEQVRELMQLGFRYQSMIGYNVEDPPVWFGSHLANYLSALALGAEIENRALKIRGTTAARQDSMQAFQSYLGRKPTPDDLIQELARVMGPVPEPIAEAIRRDVQRLVGPE